MREPVKFGNYYLLERINIGGMAEVFKAVSYGVEGFERLFAVKRVLPNIAEDQEFIDMFIDEAKIAVQLNHANIGQIFDLGHAENAYFIAMEFVQGKDLRAIFDRARRRGMTLDIPMVCHVVKDVCEALEYAHNKKNDSQDALHLVHRDVSPQNIIVSYDGEVKLIDFGIAKAAGKASRTQAGILKGKFGYMSPEQVRGRPIDRRSDLFSLGVVLFEMLTLERCFQGESDFSTLEKVRNVDIRRPSTLNRSIPPELERIVLKALAREPEHRYQSAAEFQDALHKFLYQSGTFYARKDLAAFMKGTFAQEISAEQKKLSVFRGYAVDNIPEAQRAAGRNGERTAPDPQPEEKPQLAPLSWEEDELPTAIFDRSPSKVEALDASLEQWSAGRDQPDPAFMNREGAPTVPDDRPGSGPSAAVFGGSDSAVSQPPAQRAAAPEPRPGADRRVAVPPAGAPGQRAAEQPAAGPRHQPTLHVRQPVGQEALPAHLYNTRPAGSNNRLVALVALAIIVSAIAAGLVYHLTRKTTLTVRTNPADVPVTIHLDGQVIFQGPEPHLQTFEIAEAGTHDVRVTAVGYMPQEGRVPIESGAAVELPVELKPLAKPKGASIRVQTDPPGARVKLDGRLIDDETPLTIRDVDAGAYTLSIERPGYLPLEQKLTLSAGEEKALDGLRLFPRRVSLMFVTEPSGAKLTLIRPDGQRNVLGRAPQSLAEISNEPGQRILAELPGHSPLEQPIEQQTSERAQVVLRLERGSARPTPRPRARPRWRPPPDRDAPEDDSPGIEEPPAPGRCIGEDCPPAGQAAVNEPDPPSRPEPLPVEPKAPGRISVQSIPAARVFIDGQEIQWTPLIGFEISAGTHRVRLVRDSDPKFEHEERVNVQPGQARKVRYRHQN